MKKLKAAKKFIFGIVEKITNGNWHADQIMKPRIVSAGCV